MSLNTKVLSLMKEAGRPMTTDEIAEASNLTCSAAYGVCNALWMMGKVNRIKGQNARIIWEVSS